jgi:hypothetical protein
MRTKNRESFQRNATELAKQAELNRDFSSVIQSNALFQKVEEKRTELKELGVGKLV